MEKNTKYDFRTVEKNGSWRTEIVRRASSKKSVVSKSQEGFATESDANAWGESELKSFLERQTKRNKRHALQRKQPPKSTDS